VTHAPHCALYSAGVAAALTFVPTYKEIIGQGDETWVSYLLAFENGFFYPLHFAPKVLREEAAPDAVVRHFVG
jgi:hypothetical protein